MKKIPGVEMDCEITYVVEVDQNPDNPRQAYDNLGVMICFHNMYVLGDQGHGYDHRQYAGWTGLEEQLIMDGSMVSLPLYLFDHGGITIKTNRKSFQAQDPAGWDWGRVGSIVAFDAAIRDNFLLAPEATISQEEIDTVAGILQCEVEEYDKYLRGECYYYKVISPDGVELESTYGFWNRDEAETEAKEAVAHWTKQWPLQQVGAGI